MSWNGFANPRNYNPGDWADAYETLLGFDGHVSPVYYDPGDWADGYEISGWDGYTELINYDGSTWADGYEISGWDGYAEQFVIEIGQVLGFWFPTADVDAPVLSNQDPASGAEDVPVNTNIELDITDADSGVDVNSVIITIDGYEAWKFDAYQDGYDGYKTIIPNGFRYTIDPPIDFGSYHTVTIRVEADDKETIPNQLDSYYSFRTEDTEAPILEGLDPFSDETDVDTATDVVLEITDVGSGLDAYSVIITIDGDIAWEHDEYKVGFDGYRTAIPDGYEYTIYPDVSFSPFTWIVIDVYAKDNPAPISNILNTSYQFQTDDGDPPVLTVIDPLADAIDVDPATDVVLEITDTGSGVDQDSVILTVDGHVAWTGDAQQLGYIVSKDIIVDGYRYTINPDTDFPEYKWIEIDVYAEDNVSNILNTDYQFKTWDFTAPFLVGLSPTANSHDNPRNVNITFDVVDGGITLENSIDAYVNNSLVFDGSTSTFYPPFDIGSTITPGVYDGYDGYQITLQRVADFPSYQRIDIDAYAEDSAGNKMASHYWFRIEDYEPKLILGWSFGVQDYVAPWLQNPRPILPSDRNVRVSVDILDDYSGVDVNSLIVTINAAPAFNGPSTFKSPYNGAITPTIIDGYDGYHLILDNSGFYLPDSTNEVRVTGQDAYGNTFDENFNFRIVKFANIIGLRPTLYEIALDLTFDTLMRQDENLSNPANYTFTNGMYARKVDFLDGYSVRLWTELFYGNEDFILTVNQKIKTIDGYSLIVGSDSYGVSPFESDATFTNYNGMVRTWHESTNIESDSQRAYLAGTKGIDVFAKLSNSTRFFRWGQIFDEYGIDAMYVANFPSDLVITDTVPPILTDQNPAPYSFAPAYTHIFFNVRDEITAVEITTLRIYVEGTLAFSGGYGGWQNGWSGKINVYHHQLSVEIWPYTFFDTGSIITVRVVARDLMGNELDTTYHFSILVSIGGFGGSPFGLAPFGGV